MRRANTRPLRRGNRTSRDDLGGVGIAETGFRVLTDWLSATKTLLDESPCHDGCPSCMQSPKCGNNNEPLDKAAAARILGHILTK